MPCLVKQSVLKKELKKNPTPKMMTSKPQILLVKAEGKGGFPPRLCSSNNSKCGSNLPEFSQAMLLSSL